MCKNGLISVSGNVIMDCFRHNKKRSCAHLLNHVGMGIILEVRNRWDNIISGGGSDVSQPRCGHLHTCIRAKMGSLQSREMS